MKTLIIGFLVFSGWSALSTYVYVCRIAGLCDGPATIQADITRHHDTISGRPLSLPDEQEQALRPKDIVINFAFDKSDFIADAETDMYFVASNEYLEQNVQARINITGYTDAVGSLEYNQDLGYRRAQRMQQYFEAKGLNSDLIHIESKGEREPADVNTTTSGRANNRRTLITINK
jgi:outer membrane protein OmpA-like peptidoglycan-associated protein